MVPNYENTKNHFIILLSCCIVIILILVTVSVRFMVRVSIKLSCTYIQNCLSGNSLPDNLGPPFGGLPKIFSNSVMYVYCLNCLI